MTKSFIFRTFSLLPGFYIPVGPTKLYLVMATLEKYIGLKTVASYLSHLRSKSLKNSFRCL